MPVNNSGPNFEELVTRQLQLHGIKRINAKDISGFPNDIIHSLYPKGVVSVGTNKYTSIYGNANCRTEFVVYLPNKRTIRIECKWQQTEGTAAEKIPYFYLNFVENRFPEDTLILIYGGGASSFSNAIIWLKSAWKKRLYIKKDFDKDLKIFSLDEFIAWTNNLKIKD